MPDPRAGLRLAAALAIAEAATAAPASEEVAGEPPGPPEVLAALPKERACYLRSPAGAPKGNVLRFRAECCARAGLSHGPHASGKRKGVGDGGSGSSCEHGARRARCKKCSEAGIGGGSICEHGAKRSVCKRFWKAGIGGGGIFEHGARRRSVCKRY